jgi:hypothetical protein
MTSFSGGQLLRNPNGNCLWMWRGLLSRNTGLLVGVEWQLSNEISMVFPGIHLGQTIEPLNRVFRFPKKGPFHVVACPLVYGQSVVPVGMPSG